MTRDGSGDKSDDREGRICQESGRSVSSSGICHWADIDHGASSGLDDLNNHDSDIHVSVRLRLLSLALGVSVLQNRIANHQMVIGMLYPQIAVLDNVASGPEVMASHGLSQGLFTLHHDPLPTVPKHASRGIILAATRPLCHHVYEMNSYARISCHNDTMRPRILFTVEPVTW